LDKALHYLGLVPVLLVAVILYFVNTLPSAKAERVRLMQADSLYQNYNRLAAPAFAQQLGDCVYTAKGNRQRLYTCTYFTKEDFGAIKAFYLGELRKDGWVEARTSRSGFASWCKDGNLAELQYNSPDLYVSWTFALSFSTDNEGRCH